MAMTHKIGKITRRGHKVHLTKGYLQGGTPLANGGNLGTGRGSGARVAGRRRPRRSSY